MAVAGSGTREEVGWVVPVGKVPCGGGAMGTAEVCGGGREDSGGVVGGASAAVLGCGGMDQLGACLGWVKGCSPVTHLPSGQ